jgi:hypothetical protein
MVLSVGNVARPLEHHVLEQMGHPGVPGSLVLRPDLVPDFDRNDGRRSVDVEATWSPLGNVSSAYSIRTTGREAAGARCGSWAAAPGAVSRTASASQVRVIDPSSAWERRGGPPPTAADVCRA